MWRKPALQLTMKKSCDTPQKGGVGSWEHRTQDTGQLWVMSRVVGKHAREVLHLQLSCVTCAQITTLAAGSKAACTLTRLKPPSFLQHISTSKQ